MPTNHPLENFDGTIEGAAAHVGMPPESLEKLTGQVGEAEEFLAYSKNAMTRLGDTIADMSSRISSMPAGDATRLALEQTCATVQLILDGYKEQVRVRENQLEQYRVLAHGVEPTHEAPQALQ